jgi:hypothetical protein
MDTLDLYFLATSAWLGLQSLVLLLVPRLAILILAENSSPPTGINASLQGVLV